LKSYIFDVDGTLTPSRGQIDPVFKNWFKQFCCDHMVYLVSGSDRPKTLEQLGDEILNEIQVLYSCSGNDCWRSDNNYRTSNWHLSQESHNFLKNKLLTSKFPLRTGNHIECRPGMVNFSVVGRNANSEQRSQYVVWDQQTRERESFAAEFNSLFDDEIVATIGGETGLDIAPVGSDKSQILRDFDGETELEFFGDAIFPGGNDYTIAQAITDQALGNVHQVNHWRETWKILSMFSQKI
jgi:phosphomannomutase